MKRTFIVIAAFLFTINLSAQDFSLGVLLGFNAHTTNTEKDFLFATGGSHPINFGIYSEYKINESFGVILNTSYGKGIEKSFVIKSNPDISLTGDGGVKLDALNFQLLAKYDVNKEYNKGFYFVGGPRLAFLSNVEDRRLDKTYDNLLSSSTFGLDIGFGVDFFKDFAVEVIVDFGISNLLDSASLNATTTGGFVNLKYAFFN